MCVYGVFTGASIINLYTFIHTYTYTQVSVLKVLGLSYTPSYRAVRDMSEEDKLSLLQVSTDIS